jgi:hypothetical protein
MDREREREQTDDIKQGQIKEKGKRIEDNGGGREVNCVTRRKQNIFLPVQYKEQYSRCTKANLESLTNCDQKDYYNRVSATLQMHQQNLAVCLRYGTSHWQGILGSFHVLYSRARS